MHKLQAGESHWPESGDRTRIGGGGGESRRAVSQCRKLLERRAVPSPPVPMIPNFNQIILTIFRYFHCLKREFVAPSTSSTVLTGRDLGLFSSSRPVDPIVPRSAIRSSVLPPPPTWSLATQRNETPSLPNEANFEYRSSREARRA